MKLKNACSALAAASLVVAAPAAAANQSAMGARASQSVGQEENMSGSAVIIGILALAAVIAGIVIAADGDDDVVSP